MFRKIITTLALAMVGIMAVAQSQCPFKFLGIPIDGKKSDFQAELKNKGFIYDTRDDYFIGDFNGINSIIKVHETHQKVDRVMVMDVTCVDKNQIKNRFNMLIEQFRKNDKKYAEFLTKNELIPDNENVDDEMILRDKEYSASFHFNPLYNNDELRQKMLEEAKVEVDKAIEENKDKEYPMSGQTYQEYFKDATHYQEFINMALGLEVAKIALNYSVWFRINRGVDGYYIVFYYDNENNRPNGEDL